MVRRGTEEFGYEFVGFRDGWRGPLEGDTMPLDVQAVRGILPRGGTILGSSRTNPLKSGGTSNRSGIERIKDLPNIDVHGPSGIVGEVRVRSKSASRSSQDQQSQCQQSQLSRNRWIWWRSGGK